MTDPRSVSWQLSGFGDEIDADPRVQVAVLQALGANHIDVRSAWDTNMPSGLMGLPGPTSTSGNQLGTPSDSLAVSAARALSGHRVELTSPRSAADGTGWALAGSRGPQTCPVRSRQTSASVGLNVSLGSRTACRWNWVR